MIKEMFLIRITEKLSKITKKSKRKEERQRSRSQINSNDKAISMLS